MEPLDTPPYAPLDDERTRPMQAPSTTTGSASLDGSDPHRARRVVAVAAGASFVAAVAGMALVRSGDDSATTTSNPPQPQVSAPDAAIPDVTDDDDRFGGGPDAAQPGVPSFRDDGGETQSRGS
jgi:hypothetical protein